MWPFSLTPVEFCSIIKEYCLKLPRHWSGEMEIPPLNKRYNSAGTTTSYNSSSMQRCSDAQGQLFYLDAFHWSTPGFGSSHSCLLILFVFKLVCTFDMDAQAHHSGAFPHPSLFAYHWPGGGLRYYAMLLCDANDKDLFTTRTPAMTTPMPIPRTWFRLS